MSALSAAVVSIFLVWATTTGVRGSYCWFVVGGGAIVIVTFRTN